MSLITHIYSRLGVFRSDYLYQMTDHIQPSNFASQFTKCIYRNENSIETRLTSFSVSHSIFTAICDFETRVMASITCMHLPLRWFDVSLWWMLKYTFWLWRTSVSDQVCVLWKKCNSWLKMCWCCDGEGALIKAHNVVFNVTDILLKHCNILVETVLPPPIETEQSPLLSKPPIQVFN